MLAALVALGACAQDPGFVELEPGLSYVDSTVGTGALVEPGDYIEVHYTGWVWDTEKQAKGTQFDSSHDRDEPIVLRIGKGFVVDGWDRGIPGMHQGGKRTLMLAPELAFGESGSPPNIPPAATLIFDVEVVGLPEVQMDILTAGEGETAALGDRLSVHYTGWFWKDGAPGNKFDSSHDRGRPYQLTLGAGQVIFGWEIALEGLKTGTTARVIIPPSLAYGKNGRGSIPAESTLMFEMELVEVVHP
ncbi:MAG: FKBP-type peptidyl-prolyl cis-trans isomerase [bacterium]|nr:FKBP-type peptidyl-prolyl cis-trans isomerase [bacterium]